MFEANALTAQIASGQWSPEAFQCLIAELRPSELDAWWNRVLSLDDIPDDSDALPRGCVPYMPAPIDALRRLAQSNEIAPTDVFVDVGCGVGRAALFVHLLTGARVIGVDVQPQLVNMARATALRLNLHDIEFVVADACEQAIAGSIYFLYCPFGAERTKAFLNTIRPVAAARPVTVACLDMVLPACDWLVRTQAWPDLQLFRSVSSSSGADTLGGASRYGSCTKVARLCGRRSQLG